MTDGRLRGWRKNSDARAPMRVAVGPNETMQDERYHKNPRALRRAAAPMSLSCPVHRVSALRIVRLGSWLSPGLSSRALSANARVARRHWVPHHADAKQDSTFSHPDGSGLRYSAVHSDTAHTLKKDTHDNMKPQASFCLGAALFSRRTFYFLRLGRDVPTYCCARRHPPCRRRPVHA